MKLHRQQGCFDSSRVAEHGKYKEVVADDHNQRENHYLDEYCRLLLGLPNVLQILSMSKLLPPSG